MKSVCDGSPENAESLRVEGIQCTGGHINRHLAGHKQILVENELQFRIGLIAALDHTRTGVKLQPTTGFQGKFGLYSAAATLNLGDFFVGQRS